MANSLQNKGRQIIFVFSGIRIASLCISPGLVKYLFVLKAGHAFRSLNSCGPVYPGIGSEASVFIQVADPGTRAMQAALKDLRKTCSLARHQNIFPTFNLPDDGPLAGSSLLALLAK
jgi:hypothetical protein